MWANPDIDAAAAHMRRIYDAPDLAQRKGELARRRVLENFGMDRAVQFVKARMEGIDSLRREGYVSAVAEAARMRL
jgi:hypothetical protein